MLVVTSEMLVVTSDVSGDVRDVSGDVRDVSGDVRDVSGDVRDVSGDVRDFSGDVRDFSGAATNILRNVFLSISPRGNLFLFKMCIGEGSGRHRRGVRDVIVEEFVTST